MHLVFRCEINYPVVYMFQRDVCNRRIRAKHLNTKYAQNIDLTMFVSCTSVGLNSITGTLSCTNFYQTYNFNYH